MKALRGFGIICALLTMSTGAVSATLSGFITDVENGESLPFGNVVLEWEGPPQGALSNVDGYYAVQNLKAGTYVLVVSYVGYRTYTDTISLKPDEERRLDVQLENEPIFTREVVVEAEAYKEDREVQTGFIALPTQQLQALPAVAEPDILRSLQLLPGIQAASDISSGLYIRGGGPDETLILLDQIPLYNPSHAFGFFSTFNPDAVKDMSLYKGAYPAQYGGRLSSVLDVRNRDGNRKAFEGRGGISLIAARLTLEGPAGNGSWMVSGRRTYLEPILSAIRNDSTEVPSYYFYDLNAKLNQDLDAKNKITASGYFGRDDLNLDLDEGSFINIRWGNTAIKGKWTHLFSPAVIGSMVFAGSKYTSTTNLSIFETPIQFSNSIRDLTFEADLDYFVSSSHGVSAGVLASQYDFSYRQTFNHEQQLDFRENPFLLSVYLQDQWQAGAATTVRAGLRGNYFSESSRYQVEPRFSMSHGLTPDVKVKLGGGFYHQFLQMVTTEGFSGGDFWVPLDETVSSAESWQGALGFEWEPSRRYQASVEGYYRWLNDLVVLDTKVTADSEDTQSEDVFITNGKGYAAGVELFLQRRTGALTGWLGYTLAWTRRRFDELNQGREFPPKYDRRNDVSFVLAYQMGRWSLGANFVYGTGQAFTPAAGRYTMRSPATGVFEDRALPAERNSARLLPYHRLDVSLKRQIRLFGSDAEAFLQVFNAYSRRNEWFVQFDAENPTVDPDVIKMLPIVPTLGINFKF